MWIEPEENKQNLAGQATPSVGAGGGAAQPGGTTSNPSTQNPIQANKPTQEFATVQDYLGANKQQGEDLGQKFTGALNTSLANEKNAIDTAVGQTQKDITAGSTAFNPDLVNKAASNPTAVANNPGDLNSFLGQWNAAYTGPSSFENSANYTGAANASNEAATKKAETETAGGQQQLLQDQFGVYGQGNKGLDQAILQNSSAYPTVQNQSKQFGGIQDYLTQQAGTTNAQATKAAVDTAATKQQTQGAFATKFQDLQNQLSDRTKADLATAGITANQYKSDLQSGDATKISQDMQKAGVPNNSIQDYLNILNKSYGVNPDASNYYTYNPNLAVTPSTVATPEEYANAAALQKLTGQDYSKVLNPANASQANTWNGANQGFDTTNLSSYLKGSLAQQDKELTVQPNLANTMAKLHAVDVNQPQNLANVDAAKDSAQKLIDAAKRMGYTKTPGQASWLDNLYHQAAITIANAYNSGSYTNRSKEIGGILTFENMLGKYLYGKSQYGDYNPLPTNSKNVLRSS